MLSFAALALYDELLAFYQGFVIVSCVLTFGLRGLSFYDVFPTFCVEESYLIDMFSTFCVGEP